MHSTIALRRAANSAHYTLATGAKIPKIGYGTWKLNKEEAHAGVADALKAGFRHIDSAWAYKNEDATGSAIAKSGVARKDLFLTSKLWNSFHGDNVEMGLDASLRDLGTDYLDLYLMHWPVAFANPKGSELASLKSQDGRPIENHILSQDLIQTWQNLEKMVEKGKVRNIGISNFNIRRVETLLGEAKIDPVVNQVEVNYGCPNDELLHYCEAHQVRLQAYSPLGSSDFVEEYASDPVVVDVAKRNNITPVQALLAWHIGRGINPITRSRKPERLTELLEAANVELPYGDVAHLLKEAENKPIQRVVNPQEAWNVKEDIFEDGVDQTRLGSLKTDSLEVPLPHEQGTVSEGTSAYLEPRNDPSSELKPTEQVARFHTVAGNRALNARGSRGSTAMQQLMKQRAFSSSPRASASASSASASRASSFLSGSSKQALATPGLKFADGRNAESRQTTKMNMCTAICDAQGIALATDETTTVFGEDVAFGVFRATAGLRDMYGRDRVFNTPLSEQGIVGFGIGMAAMGHTAVAEIQFADYIFPAFDQIVNEAAKYRYRSGGLNQAGKLTIRAPCQAVGHGGCYHSQSVEQFFLPVPGLNVVVPRSPIQAKGLLLASIRSEDPSIVLEPKILYRSSVEQVPTDDYIIPIGQAEVLRKGSDLTLVSWGAPLYSCMQAIDMLKDAATFAPGMEKHIPASLRGASIELIDLQTILPWDRETVIESVQKTGKCVVVSEAPVTGSVGSEIAAEVQRKAFLRLEAPIARVGGLDTPFPHIGETFYKPDALRILDQIMETLQY